MSTRQYIGARYVPKIFSGAGGSSEWVSGIAYEALIIVTHLGNSYTSKKPVPVGIDITNTEYWVATGLYNEQIEQYRQDTLHATNVANIAILRSNTSLEQSTSALNVAASANNNSRLATQTANSALVQSNTNTADISALEARVDEITNLPTGSTSGDAELADIRIDADGKTWTNAGNSIRGYSKPLHEILKPSINMFDASAGVSGLLSGTSGGTCAFNANSDYITVCIPVKAGTYNIMSASDNAIGARCVALSTENKQLAVGVTFSNTYFRSGSNDVVYLTFDTDCYMYVSVANIYADTMTVAPFRCFNQKSYVPYKKMLKDISYVSGVLTNKKVVSFGDSISRGYLSGALEQGIVDRLALYCDMNATNYSVSGATFSDNSGQNCIQTQINNAEASNDVQYVLLQGGVNDITHGSLGTVTAADDFTTVNCDGDTFCGGLEKSIFNCITKYPNARIVFITTHKCGSHLTNYEPFYEKTLEICAKWCIPVVDMYKNSGLNLGVPVYVNLYGAEDPTTHHRDASHINKEAYDTFYVPMVANKLAELTI